ncbi:MAG TPA: hypothetical protein VNA16_06615, partial [Abditibacteriaceae bacterium]|nr:hypothetical protein [Abditibacteriaceae bacterium]
MRKFSISCCIGVAVIAASSSGWAQPALTIYNQNFGVVRQTVALDLKGDVNRIQVSDITAFVEPDSVILRDPTGKRELR